MAEGVEERESLKKDVSTMYGLRSRAVHQGVIPHSRANLSYMTKAQDLCRQSIITTIHHARETGQLPNWNPLELVLGQIRIDGDRGGGVCVWRLGR